MSTFTTSLGNVKHLCLEYSAVPPKTITPIADEGNTAGREVSTQSDLLLLPRLVFPQNTGTPQITIHFHDVPNIGLVIYSWSGSTVHFHLEPPFADPDISRALVEQAAAVVNRISCRWPPHAQTKSRGSTSPVR